MPVLHLECGTSPENDARVRALHERVARMPRAEAKGTGGPLAREGAFYLPTDERITPGYRPLDLLGQSLVFEPRAGSKYSLRREASRYMNPPGDALHDFNSREVTPWHYRAYDIQSFAFPLFGQQVSRVHLSAFNGIHLTAPAEVTAQQFDDLEAAVHRQPLLSPLMMTNRKPRQLRYPKLFVHETADALFVTWRSTGGEPFEYDVQAELRKDGTIVYSYRSMKEMRWGAPVLTAGFDPTSAVRRQMGFLDDPPNDVSSVTTALRPMVDIRRVEAWRYAESDLFAIRLTLGGPIDTTKLTGAEFLRYVVQVGAAQSVLDVNRDGHTITSFAAIRGALNGAAARIDGNIIELYGVQLPADSKSPLVRAFTFVRPSTRSADFASSTIQFGTPSKSVATDLSAAANGTELSLPILEAYALGTFDPYEVWERLQDAFALSDYDVDAVAMYQTFYSDIIFYAGAYSTGGNPQVDGIWTTSPFHGQAVPRETSLLHMNQLTYNYNTAETTASKVMLHEFGHRWLYFFRIKDGDALSNVLNPLTAHPAAYVHTPAAFPVYGENESSVMGGGVFTQQSDGAYRARSLNMGFSWTDLYLMGLATREEVQPWFYLADTDPPLALEYWPVDGTVVHGNRKAVSVDQIIGAHGERQPSAAMSQKKFKVLFVLVTDDPEPTAEQVAKLNQWRTLIENNFAIATGGRGRLETSWEKVPRRRAVR